MKDNLMEMNLQFFAEEQGSEVTESTEVNEEVTTEEVAAETETEDVIDSDKVVEKLQKRLKSINSEKKEANEELDKALKRIAELENANKKGVKQLSEEDKAKQLQAEKDKEINELREQLKLNNITMQVDEALKESGFALSKEELDLVVDTDEEKAYQNIKTLISLINKDREQQAYKRNVGVTPKKVSEQRVAITKEQFDAMTFAEKSKLATTDPQQFKKLTGG